MHHKRGRPKNARGGCLLCKPHKCNGGRKLILQNNGFGKIRGEIQQVQDLKDSVA